MIIEPFTFDQCTSLESITIPANVTSIGQSAFYKCTGLKSITIPASVQTIDDEAFCLCRNLATVTFAEGSRLEKIGNGAFSECVSLAAIRIPASVKQIGRGNGAFSFCTGLTNITVDSGNAHYSSEDGILYNKAKTILHEAPGAISGHFTIPAGVETIDLGAFGTCSRLTGVTIPDSVKAICHSAFARCTSLTSVTFAAEGASLGLYPFPEGKAKYGGDSLKNAYLEGGAGTYVRDSGGSKWTKQ